MSKHEMDELFREKLGGLELTPRAQAWDKLDTKLNKKQKKGMFVLWKVAAALLVLLVVSFLIFQMKTSTEEVIDPIVQNDGIKNEDQVIESLDTIDPINKNNNQNAIAQEIKEEEKTEDQITDIAKGDRKENQVNTIAANTQNNKQKQSNSFNIESTDVIAANDEKVKNEENEAVMKLEVEPIDKIDIKNSLIVDNNNIATPDIIKTEQKIGAELPNISITFKKTTPKSDGDLAVADQKKDRRFKLKSVLNFAKDIKNGEVGLSNLREAKDELLAFDINAKKKKAKAPK
ncbi:hypothetical protein QQ008_07025 [Fulvivirgaceae bacterium BMA10]|uniref:Energy transducer TonB n=1 Tax=Splendidivirga corallicola TaxID=3051826 RepID=A0ABT8KNH7_9BACT|nr:hypothetical protein [Fulvivirgaceae bacterium BMA10]